MAGRGGGFHAWFKKLFNAVYCNCPAFVIVQQLKWTLPVLLWHFSEDLSWPSWFKRAIIIQCLSHASCSIQSFGRIQLIMVGRPDETIKWIPSRLKEVLVKPIGCYWLIISKEKKLKNDYSGRSSSNLSWWRWLSSLAVLFHRGMMTHLTDESWTTFRNVLSRDQTISFYYTSTRLLSLLVLPNSSNSSLKRLIATSLQFVFVTVKHLKLMSSYRRWSRSPRVLFQRWCWLTRKRFDVLLLEWTRLNEIDEDQLLFDAFCYPVKMVQWDRWRVWVFFSFF